ncbi:lymphocyte antigen 86 isoform X12 [Trachypithecus francoisi]|uniref:lymphocyte antigen 86 isoform X12 n=1 Tax=Trachypithecus francoisi TaxID=54180 RepID=UPI00141B0156|nr:lymphocyte antigen 86 isoform X12 [Trachypithecus francoisi]
MVACALSFPSLQPHLGCSEEPREALTMKGFTAALFLGTLIFPSCSGGSGGRAWPTHTVCSDSGLEVLYQSCDPLQDFGFSIEKCSKQLKSNINIRFGIILKQIYYAGPVNNPEFTIPQDCGICGVPYGSAAGLCGRHHACAGTMLRRLAVQRKEDARATEV